MAKNYIEQSIIPGNLPSSKVIQKNKFNLFAPTATDTTPGIAAFSGEDFEIAAKKVKLKKSAEAILEEANDYADEGLYDIYTLLSDEIESERVLREDDDEELRKQIQDISDDTVHVYSGPNTNLGMIYGVYVDADGKKTPIYLMADQYKPDGDFFRVALRDAKSRLMAGDPVEEYHAANKKYVDDLNAKSERRTIGRVSYNGGTGELVFTSVDGKEILDTVDLPIESLVSDVKFDDMSENLIFTKFDGSEIVVPVTSLLNPAWIQDVSKGGNTPPTAEAVKTYVDEADALIEQHISEEVETRKEAINGQQAQINNLNSDVEDISMNLAMYHVPQIQDNTDAIAKNKSDLESVTRRVDNLEDVLVEEKEVTSDKYVTPVPANVGRYALLNEVGGMTHRVEKRLYPTDGSYITKGGEDNFDGGIYPIASGITAQAPFIVRFTNAPAEGYFGQAILGVKVYYEDGTTETIYSEPDKIQIETDVYGEDSWEVCVAEGAFKTPSVLCTKQGISYDIIAATPSEFGYGFNISEGEIVSPPELQSAKVTAIESRGKNLYNKNNVEPYGYITTGNKLEVHSGYKSVFIDVRGLDSITISNRTPDNYDMYAIVLNSKEVGSLSREGYLYVGPGGKKCTISLKSSNYIANYLCISIWASNFDIVAPYTQVEVGETATEYTPYREPITYTLPKAITDREEFGLGVILNDPSHRNVLYSNTVDFENKKYYPNRAKEITFNGTENWAMETLEAGINFYYDEVIEKAVKNTVVCCNHYDSAHHDGTRRNIAFISNTGKLNILADGFNSLDEWKAKLAEWEANDNPLTVVCGLDDDTAEDIYINDNVIEVEPGGSLVAVNEYSLDAPTKVSYIVAKGGNAE